MKLNKMYIVTMSHGEYDDYTRHNLCVVNSEDEARFIWLSLEDHDPDFIFLIENTGLENNLRQLAKEELNKILNNYSFGFEEIPFVFVR